MILVRDGFLSRSKLLQHSSSHCILPVRVSQFRFASKNDIPAILKIFVYFQIRPCLVQQSGLCLGNPASNLRRGLL